MLGPLGRAGALSLLLVTVACEGDDPVGRPMDRGDAGGTPVTPVGEAAAPRTGGERFLQDYASAVCRLYEPCCRDEGLGYDGEGCTDWFRRVTAALFPGEFLPSAGAECLAAMEAVIAAEPDRCSTVPLFDEATLRRQCRAVFTESVRDGKPLGEACSLASDCAATAEHAVVCEGRCRAVRDGKDGEGPCLIPGNEEGTDIYRCHAEDGLHCDRAENVCRSFAAPGERCLQTNACGPDVLCRGGFCEDLPGPGEPCANAVPGAGGFCRAGSACDIPTLTCGEALPIGAPCREPSQCLTRVCDRGVCGEPEFKKRLNCTG